VSVRLVVGLGLG